MLNPELYETLKRLYGEVRIRNENVYGDWEVVDNETSDGFRRVYLRHREGGSWGEQYVLNCPFCSDTRFRLNVSHVYGRPIADTDRVAKCGVHCYNEDCHLDRVSMMELWEEISLRIRGTSHEISESTSADQIETGPVPMPGKTMSLRALWLRDRNHPVLQYLVDRGFNLDCLDRMYGVQYIVRGYRLSMLDDRVFIPFYRGDKLIGWTARDTTQDTEKKYINSTGGLGGYMYGLASAVQNEVAVLVEGPMDRWSVGNASFALLNKRLGFAKQVRLRNAASSMRSRLRLAVVLLDPTQNATEAAKGKLHQLDQAVKDLTEMGIAEVLPVRLPAWLDPGASHGSFLASYLSRELKDAGHARLGKVLAGSVLSSSATI